MEIRMGETRGSPEKSSSTGKVPLLIFFALALVGSPVAYWGYTIVLKARASASWPSVKGVITSSRVATRRSRHKDSRGYTRTRTTYFPSISYKYTVGGKNFSGTKRAFGESSSSNRAWAAGVVSHYYPGSEVEVYYNPDDPADAVLEPGVTMSSYAVLIIGGLFVAIGVLGATGVFLREWFRPSPGETPGGA